MRKTTKVIVGSALTMAMCATLITGATLALFTSEDNVNIAVSSGKVDVQASVANLWTYSNAVDNVDLDKIEDWTPGTGSGTTLTGNFTETGGTATYSVDGGTGTLTLTNIAPGDAVKFTLSIANNSNISIKYQIRMLTTNDEYVGTPPDPYDGTKLSSALEVKIGSEETKTGLAYAYSPYTPWPNAEGSIGTDIIIRLPKDTGNAYKDRSCSITLTVRAIQSNARETSYCQEVGKHVYGEDNCLYCGEANPYKSHHNETEDTYTINGVDSGVSELYIPSEINGKEVKLAPGTFQDNTELETVVFGEGFTELVNPISSDPIQWGAFYGCTNLTSVTLPSTLEKINRYSFYGCTSLKSIEIPASVTFIGDNAFYGSGLESVSLPEGLVTIDSDAFFGTHLKHIEIPDSVTEIGYRAFASCTELESAKIGNGLTKIKGWSNGNSGTSGVFHNCPNLYSVELGSAVTTIEEGAFHLCYRLVEVINHSTYDAKTKAEGDVEGDVGYYAAEIREGADATKSRITSDGDYRFYTTKDGKKYLVGYVGEGERVTLTLPDDGEEYEIYNYAFYQNKKVTDVTFGNSVTAIGDYAFAETQLGTSAYFDFFIAGDKVPLREEPDSAKVGKIKSIGAHAFENAIKQSTKLLTSRIYLADTVESIGEAAFAGCNALQEVYIGGKFFSKSASSTHSSQLKEIGEDAFKDCKTIGSNFYFRNTTEVWIMMTQGKNVFSGNISNGLTVVCNNGKLDKNGDPKP